MKRLMFFLASVMLLVTSMSFAGNKALNFQTMTVPSSASVDVTTNLLMKKLQAAGFLIKGTVDHQAMATLVGQKIPANKEIMFGKPSFDYALVSKNPKAALILPMTLVVWQNQNGNTNVTYWNLNTSAVSLFGLQNDSRAMKAVNQVTNAMQKVTSGL